MLSIVDYERVLGFIFLGFSIDPHHSESKHTGFTSSLGFAYLRLADSHHLVLERGCEVLIDMNCSGKNFEILSPLELKLLLLIGEIRVCWCCGDLC